MVAVDPDERSKWAQAKDTKSLRWERLGAMAEQCSTFFSLKALRAEYDFDETDDVFDADMVAFRGGDILAALPAKEYAMMFPNRTPRDDYSHDADWMLSCTVAGATGLVPRKCLAQVAPVDAAEDPRYTFIGTGKAACEDLKRLVCLHATTPHLSAMCSQ